MHLKLFSPSVTAYAVPPPSSEGGIFLYRPFASPVFGVRVSCGHLCEAEAPTEAAAETVGRESASEGLLQT